MSAEKTEKPTPKRLRDLRRKGQVARSREVISAALTIAFFTLFVVSLPGMIDQFEAMILLPVPFLEADLMSATQKILQPYVATLQLLLAPFVGIVLMVGVGANVIQIGPMFTPKALKPALNRLSPSENVKRIVSLRNLIELGKSIGKILVVGSVLLLNLREGLQALVWTSSCGISCLRGVTGNLLLGIAIYVGLTFLTVAIADFVFQRWHFSKTNMMSNNEVKREYKESNGDPLMIAKRKQLHMQLLAKGVIDQSRKATVLITNPTHVAVAIYYDRQHTPLPLISAIGTDLMARQMIDAAVATAVPVMRNIPLARALLKDGLVDEYIPSHLLEPIAEVLRALGKLATEAGGRSH
ncbi:type III secretion system substrate-exporter YscU/HrpY family protein (plasmid) [Rhizobium etli bv. phaseoli str. IE4803]|nr:type III secretion system substrate-exporter YscU/HrpY family protein [Rhizobium etli bv. phaseoli str. IE4803]